MKPALHPVARTCAVALIAAGCFYKDEGADPPIPVTIFSTTAGTLTVDEALACEAQFISQCAP